MYREVDMEIVNKKRKKVWYFKVFFCLFTFALLVIWVLWGNKALIIDEVDIYSNNIPISFSDFQIAQISDLHNAEFGGDNELLLQKLIESNPDIIVITGDFIDAQHTDIEIALSFAEKAVKVAPTYYVTGNHEAAIEQYDVLKVGLEEVGVMVLEDKAISLDRNGESITLIGLSDPDMTLKGDLFGEVPAMVYTKLSSLNVEKSEYTILLSHRPELFETYVACGVDLVLSGHAHGGQFRLPFAGGLIAPNQGFFPKYDAGLFINHDTNMVVSRGIGNSVIPFRINNRPEIVLVRLRNN